MKGNAVAARKEVFSGNVKFVPSTRLNRAQNVRSGGENTVSVISIDKFLTLP